MMNIKIGDFVEFQNTRNAKIAFKKECSEGLGLRFTKIQPATCKNPSVQCNISTALLECMKKNRLCTFKMLFNEKTNEIIFQYDNSSNAINVDDYKEQKVGIQFTTKLITYTMLPVIGDKKSISYICEYNDTLRLVLCSPKRE